MARAGTTPAPALLRYVVALTSADAAGLALIAATTCAAVLVSAPVSLVARLTTMSLPVTATLSGGVVGARVLELGGDLVAAEVAPVLGGQHDRGGRGTAAEPEVGWTLNVKSPMSPWKPEISIV